jgi:tetratricopeptide (TPR) repeat protein
MFGPDHPQVANRLLGLALVHRDLGDFSQAVALLRRAQAIIQSSSWFSDPLAALVENGLANAYFDIGAVSQGAELLERSLELQEKLLGTNRPEPAPGFDGRTENLANYYLRCGDCTGTGVNQPRMDVH